MSTDADPDVVRDALASGDLDLVGRLVTASNATFLATVEIDGASVRCVYKPERGERPLWDFPDTPLSRREVATYVVSEAGGWGLVPPTVMRDSGPYGGGMCQLWVETGDHDAVDLIGIDDDLDGRLPVLQAEDEHGRPVVLVHDDTDALRAMALFDVVCNNADRKGGHVLSTSDRRLLGCDHGLCFHSEPKLRTVLWGWAGERLQAHEVDRLTRLWGSLAPGSPLEEVLDEYLAVDEVRALRQRVDALLETGHLPVPGEGWPAIPWPPF